MRVRIEFAPPRDGRQCLQKLPKIKTRSGLIRALEDKHEIKVKSLTLLVKDQEPVELKDDDDVRALELDDVIQVEWETVVIELEKESPIRKVPEEEGDRAMPRAAADGAGIEENRKSLPEDLKALQRRQLQKYAKKFGINAGQTSVAIRSELEKLRGTVAQPAVQPAVRPTVQSAAEPAA